MQLRKINPYLLLTASFQQGVERCSRLLDLSENDIDIDIVKSRADLFYAKGVFYYHLNKFGLCDESCEKAKNIFKSLMLEDSSGFYYAEDLQMNASIESGDPEMIFKAIDKINLDILKRKNNPDLQNLLPDSFLNSGRCYMALKKYAKALQEFLMSWEMFDKFEDSNQITTIISIQSGIFAALVSLGDCRKARGKLVEFYDLVFATPNDPENVDNRMLISLVEYTSDLLINLKDGKRAAQLFHLVSRWRIAVGKKPTGVAKAEFEERRKGIVHLIGEYGLAAEMRFADDLEVVDVAAMLRDIAREDT